MHHPRAAVLILCALSMLVSACASSAASPTPTVPSSPSRMTVGLVTDVGGLKDRSFNHLAALGLHEARVATGIHYTILESKVVSQYVPYLTRLARRHVALIIAVGFSMGSAVYQVATTYTGARFAMVDAAPVDASGTVHNLPNVANLFFDEQQAGYLAGVIAGLMEKRRVGSANRGTIAYLGGSHIPQVDRYLAGYVAGARRVDPGVRVLGEYADGFSDPATGERIGLDQIQRGADILFPVAADTGQGYLAAAEKKGRYGIGVDASEEYLGPFIITSAVKRVDVAVRDVIHSVAAGTFAGGDHQFGLRQNGVGIAPVAPVVPPSIVTVARAYRRLLAAGRIVPPTAVPHS